ncbi:hypothetical protein LOD99_7176 [Oopsacas minuta]|uniref:Endonuclease/exonuclease/phosphatase domain-containing protein n=1 Tax=Oopsacas minuta TaxID=111878 RepID=A0AAV7JUB6_9METZ|nr:hypothetical protein LOD99_7176 [Oopsacas minuta]
MILFLLIMTALINSILVDGSRYGTLRNNQDSDPIHPLYYLIYGNIIAKEISSVKQGLEMKIVEFIQDYFSPQLLSYNCQLVQPLYIMNLSRTALYLSTDGQTPLRVRISWINAKGIQVFQRRQISKGVLISFRFYSICEKLDYLNEVTLLYRESKFHVHYQNHYFIQDRDYVDKSLRILTLNIWNTNSRNNTLADYLMRLELMIEEIQKSKADIIGLQEVRFDSRQIGVSPFQMEQLSLRLPQYNYIYQPASLDISIDVTNSTLEEGLVIMSRFPISSWSYILLPSDIFLDVHQRICLQAEIEIPGGSKLHAFVTHLSLNHELRELSVQDIVHFMSAFEGNKVLFGDMNSEPDSAEMQYLRDTGLNDAWLAFYPEPEIRPPRSSGNGVQRFYGLTFDATDLQLRKRIDFIYLDLSNSLIANNIELIGLNDKDIISDHLGVLLSNSISTSRSREDL